MFVEGVEVNTDGFETNRSLLNSEIATLRKFRRIGQLSVRQSDAAVERMNLQYFGRSVRTKRKSTYVTALIYLRVEARRKNASAITVTSILSTPVFQPVIEQVCCLIVMLHTHQNRHFAAPTAGDQIAVIREEVFKQVPY